MPTLTFGIWLAGLIVAVLILLSLAPLAYRGVAVVRIAVYPYAAIMVR